MNNRPLIYLACPYSHSSEKIREQRFHAVCRAAGKLMSDGHIVYSPIAHNHPISDMHELPKSWEYWKRFDEAHLSCCHKLIVLMLPGWKESVGVKAEMEIAYEQGIPVEFMEEV